jgi:hypothetical protein
LLLRKEDYDDFEKRDEANSELRRNYRLGFEPSDIRYIIVAREDEVLPMIREVERIKDKYTGDQKRLLASRVISAEQIAADF